MTKVVSLDEPETSASHEILHDRVVDFLRDMIITGELQPGERIPERSLCAQLNISRTPLREALKVLAAEEMVALLPYRGAVVRKVLSEEAAEILAVIGALEEWAARLASRHATDEEIAAISAKHAQMTACYQEGDLEGYFKHNLGFHETIILASHNATLMKVYKSLNNRVVKQRLVWNLKMHRWKDSVRHHEKMMQALIARDEDALAAAISEHYADAS